MVIMQLSPVYGSMVTNNKLEGVICIVLVAFWSGIVSIVSDANNNLAVRHATDGECNNTVLNGNLYYFSWAAFVTSISLLISYLRSVFGVDLVGSVTNKSQRLELWSGMLACALVVMGASSNILQIDCKPVQDELDTYCARTKFAISIGTIGSFFSIAVVGMKLVTATAPFVFEGLLSLILAILNGCGVAFITVRVFLFYYVASVLFSFLPTSHPFYSFSSHSPSLRKDQDLPCTFIKKVNSLSYRVCIFLYGKINISRRLSSHFCPVKPNTTPIQNQQRQQNKRQWKSVLL